MPKHHSEDYKLCAVKYYLKIDNQLKTCEIFKCSERSLKLQIMLLVKNNDSSKRVVLGAKLNQKLSVVLLQQMDYNIILL